MPCVNCQAKHLNLNKEINLPVCSVCGCIQAYRIYEVSDIPKNEKTFSTDLMMLMNEFDIEDKDEVIKNDKQRRGLVLFYTIL